ncbi:MAG: hypothetical protein IPP77_10400 [Bacteroidetes bacterium]|nr:hypothetical protein [Bacteroidota bacterium]
MKRLSIFRLCLSLSFTLVVMTTVSFHEVHYLFTHHAEHEHCENHLHANDHNHCSVCKFDVSVFH